MTNFSLNYAINTFLLDGLAEYQTPSLKSPVSSIETEEALRGRKLMEETWVVRNLPSWEWGPVSGNIKKNSKFPCYTRHMFSPQQTLWFGIIYP